jgi:alcohol dehydrogenase
VTQPETVAIRDLEVPDIDGNHALLRVELTGVCGTDPTIYRGEHDPEILPAILGHELVGRIEAAGESFREEFDVEPGDRVVVDATKRCGQCEYCIRGRYQFCEQVTSHGFTSTEVPPGLWGGHAEYVYLTPEAVLYPLEERVPAEAGVMAGAVVGNSVAWLQSVDQDLLGKSIAIQGPGPQGLSAAKVARDLGLSPVAVVGVPGDEARLALAEEIGADMTVCAPPDQVVSETIGQLGERPDVVMNVTGVPGTAQQSIDLVDTDGTIVYPSMVGDGVTSEVRFNELVVKNARIQGVFTSTAEHIEAAIELIERDPEPFARMVSHTYPIQEAEDAYRDVGGGADDLLIKAVIDPSA